MNDAEKLKVLLAIQSNISQQIGLLYLKINQQLWRQRAGKKTLGEQLKAILNVDDIEVSVWRKGR
jgi:hypothetical protein